MMIGSQDHTIAYHIVVVDSNNNVCYDKVANKAATLDEVTAHVQDIWGVQYSVTVTREV